MAHTLNSDILSEEFLIDLYRSCFTNDNILSLVCTHIKTEYLPDKDFIVLHNALKTYFRQSKTRPLPSVIRQAVASKRSVSALLDEILDDSYEIECQQILQGLEDYIRQVRLVQVYKEIGELYNKGERKQAEKAMLKYTEWLSEFTLSEDEFIDVIGTFEERFTENRKAHNEAQNSKAPVTRFYIDEIDARNQGKNLRTQLTCILAPSGVGKTHAARWIGSQACIMDGLDVLHVQLEGSRSEVLDAYSASLVGCSTYLYETGRLRDSQIQDIINQLSTISGRIYVKSYPKFNAHVSTVDVYNTLQKYKKKYGKAPDILIIDSMDLLEPSTNFSRSGDKEERKKRIAVANDLKDLASEEDLWVVVTYQSTIENREWLNDEKNVLTEYNCAEAKGLVRPLTHLITLNQSDAENREKTMRINIAKSRFFAKGPAFKIATDYDHEMFYDKKRTITLTNIG